MFCTGIENSIPTINNGKTRIDQMEACDHYRRWRDDFDLLHDIGLNYLRYGPPIHRTFLGPGRYDWEFTDLTRSEEHTSELQSLMRISYAVFCLKKKNIHTKPIPKLSL